MKKVLPLLLCISFAWAQYSDTSEDTTPSSRSVNPQVRHLRELYQQYTRRAFEYRGLSEKFYEKDQGEKKHYAKLADEYEKKASDISQQLENLETGGLIPPSPSERVARRKVEKQQARAKQNEKERVGCNLQRRINTSTWQQIPSSTGIGRFPSSPASDIYPGCGEYQEE